MMMMMRRRRRRRRRRRSTATSMSPAGESRRPHGRQQKQWPGFRRCCRYSSRSSSSISRGRCSSSSSSNSKILFLLLMVVVVVMVTTMTMTTLLLSSGTTAFVAASTTTASGAGAADLYDISEPVVVNSDDGGIEGVDGLMSVLLLRLKYGISELQQTTDNIGVELYDEGCRDGRRGRGPDDDVNDGEPYLVDESVLTTRLSLLLEEGQEQTNANDDSNLLDVAVLMNPQTISQDQNIFVYEDDNTGANAKIKFCVRVMLFVDSSLEIEVNYVETVVTVDVDLTDGFDVGEFQTAPKEQIDKRAFLPSQVEGFFCDDCYNRIEVKPNYKVVFNQGSFVRVCVRATDETLLSGVSIKQLWSFQYRRSQQNNDDLIQVAVQDGGLPSSDGLSEVDCPFPNLCVITTLLQAKFFPSPGILVGGGFAILQINKDTVSNNGLGRGRDRDLRRDLRRHDRHPYHLQDRHRRHHLRQMQEQQVPAPLDQYWNITNPDFRFNEDTDDGTDITPPETGTGTTSSSKTLDFDLVYEISDAMSSENVVVDLYSKGCALEGTLVSDIQQSSEGGGDPSGGSGGGVVITHSTVSDAVQTGLGYETQNVEYSVGLDPSKVVDYSQLYVESSNGGFGQVQLCARMSLFTGGGGEVNFWETPVVLNFNFQSNLLLDMTVLPPSSSSSVEDLQQQLPGLETVTTYCSELFSASSSSSSSSSLSLSEASGLEPRALDGVYIIPESLVVGIEGGDEEGSISGDVDLGPGFTWSSSASSSRLTLPLLPHHASSLHARLFHSFVHIMVMLPILCTFVFI